MPPSRQTGIPEGHCPMRNALPTVLLLCLASASASNAAIVSGRVLERATQAPIGGADVEIYYPGILGFPSLLKRTTTGSDGRYSVSVDYSGPIGAIARADGHAARTHGGLPCTDSPDCISRGALLPLDDAGASADFALGREARIVGRIRDGGSEKPPYTAWMTLRHADSSETGLVDLVNADAEGRFTLRQLHPGDYTLHVWGTFVPPGAYPVDFLDYVWPGLHCDDVQIRCDGLTPGYLSVAEGDVVQIDVALRRGSYFRTRVISNGNGLPTTHVTDVLPTTPNSYGIQGHEPGDTGYALVGPLLPGNVHVVIQPAYAEAYPRMIYPDRPCAAAGCDMTGAAVVEVPAADGVHTLDDVHVDPLRTIRGRVTASDGEPIAGLRVDAGTIGAPAHHAWGFRSTANTLTNADGEYRLEGFAGTEVVVRTRQNGLGWLDKAWQNEDCDAANLFCQSTATEPDLLAFAQQPHPAGIDFVLQRGASLRGRVVEASTNRPLANHAVAVVPLEVLRVGKPVYTDTNGEFRIDGLTAHDYFLFASPEYVYGNTHGILYPDQPCTMSVLPNGTNTCFPTTQAPLQLAAGAVIADLTIVVPRADALFADRFGG